MILPIILIAGVAAFFVTLACTQEETSVTREGGREYAHGAGGERYQIRYDWSWWRGLIGIYLVAFVIIGVVTWLVWPNDSTGFQP